MIGRSRLHQHTVAGRIGARIRQIRTEKNISRTAFGKAVGLTADRVQKYENGVSAPKEDMLQKMADTLDVDILSLREPTLTNDLEVMYTLFELENRYDIVLKEDDGNVCISFDAEKHPQLSEGLRAWHKRYLEYAKQYQKASTNEDRLKSTHEYRNWKYNFPKNSPVSLWCDTDEAAMIDRKIKSLENSEATLVENGCSDISPYASLMRDADNYYRPYQ